MTAPGWRTSLVVHAVGVRTGRPVPVVIGLIETMAGGIQVAVRVGEDGDPMVLPLQAAGQLELNIRAILAERFRLTIDTVGGEEP